MNTQSQPQPPKYSLSYKLQLPFRPLLWMVSFFRMTLILIPLTVLYVYHGFLSKLLFIDVIKRYFTCVVNLIWIRLLLLLMGFIQFDNNSYKFFERSHMMKFTLRSGYIGIANHSNIVDFLFYAYLLSPLFVRVVIVIHEDEKQEYLFAPLSFLQALGCALTARGFQPIVIKESQINKVKYRKLKMSLLVVESFQNLKGPILILLPGIHPGRYIPISAKIVQVLSGNQTKFSRWTVGFCTNFYGSFTNHLYHDQYHTIVHLTSSLTQHRLKITAQQFHRNYYYEKDFATSINEFYQQCNLVPLPISYPKYIQNFNREEEVQKIAGVQVGEEEKDQKDKVE